LEKRAYQNSKDIYALTTPAKHAAQSAKIGAMEDMKR
jgi:hypothetical protein